MKKTIAGICCVCLLLTGCMSLPAQSAGVLSGDMDGDGILTTKDIRWCMECIVVGEAYPEHVDINGDGVLDSYDIRLALEKLVGS